MTDSFRWLGRWALLLLLLTAAVARAQGDLPTRVGRIAAVSGEVWLFDTESRDWVAATRNRPLTQGDRLAVSAGGSAELQVGASALRLDGDTEIEATRLDDERLQFVLHRGSVGLRQHEAELAAQLELLTPEARLQPLRAGWYRIDRYADSSSATNWRGLLRATTRDVVLTLESGQRLDLGPETAGAALPTRWLPPASDAFSAAFLRDAEAAVAAPDFVSAEMTGVADLARHGNWQQHPEFGWAWSPAVVAPQWAPYRFGQWVWVQPWGWTWVDAAPWGFAPFRYGRWFWWGNRWSWAPGPGRPRPVVVPVGPGVIVGGRPPPPPLGWMPPPRGGLRPGYGPDPVWPHRPHPGKPPQIRPNPPPVGGAAPGPLHGRPVGSVPPPGTREPLIRPVSPPRPVAAAPGPPPAAPAGVAPPAPKPAPPQAAPKPAAPPAAGPFKPGKDVAERRRSPESHAPGRER